MVYCGHEYTQSNIRFALTIEPDNAALQKRAKEVDALRAAGKATLPTRMDLELETNPFLRPRCAGHPAAARHGRQARVADLRRDPRAQEPRLSVPSPHASDGERVRVRGSHRPQRASAPHPDPLPAAVDARGVAVTRRGEREHCDDADANLRRRNHPPARPRAASGGRAFPRDVSRRRASTARAPRPPPSISCCARARCRAGTGSMRPRSGTGTLARRWSSPSPTMQDVVQSRSDVDLAAGERPQAVGAGAGLAAGAQPRRLDAGRLYGCARIRVRGLRNGPAGLLPRVIDGPKRLGDSRRSGPLRHHHALNIEGAKGGPCA